MILPVVLAGGFGERLWPLSRRANPKQFVSYLDKLSLFQHTLLRIKNSPKPIFYDPVIVCHSEHRFLVAEQLRQLEMQSSAIILEPERKNTAAAIALGALWGRKFCGDPQMLVLPSDHYMEQDHKWYEIITSCTSITEHLITFGIKPSVAETGYGYIEQGEQLVDLPVHKVNKFIEKPNKSTAQQLIENDNCLWNSGMFLFYAACYLKQLDKFNPQIASVTKQAMQQATTDHDFIRVSDEYSNSPNISIDYAVMEKTNCAVVCPLDVKWSDLGSWQAICELAKKDQDNNYITGNVIAVDTKNSFIDAKKHLITTLGVSDLIIIETMDAVLIANKNDVQAVKKIVEKLKEQEAPEVNYHSKVMRPWGWFETISRGPRFQVKRLFVRENASLSLQLHHHRSEHWVVMQGIAKVTKDKEQFLLHENASTYIPVGTKHRLENVGKIPLEIIEVQLGSYVGEDDIVRFADHHGRKVCDSNYI